MVVLTLMVVFFINSITTSIVATSKSTATQSYCSPDDMKCVTNSEYSTLLDSFVELISEEIVRNNTKEALKILNAVAPEDDLRIQKIVECTMKRTDLKLSNLLQFIDEITSPSIRLNCSNNIFHAMNKTGTRALPAKYLQGYGMQDWKGKLKMRDFHDWLNLEHYVANSVIKDKDEKVYNVLLSDIQTSAKNVLMGYNNYTVAGFFNDALIHHQNCVRHCNYDWRRECDREIFVPIFLSFIVKSYLNKDPKNIRKVMTFLRHLDSSLELIGFHYLSDQLENNDIFMLIPSLKYLLKFQNNYYQDYNQRLFKEFLQKIPNDSVIRKILSDDHFLIRNVHNKGYLYMKREISNSSSKIEKFNLAKTVPNFDSFADEGNWKFSSDKNSGQYDEYLLKITNEINETSQYLVPVICVFQSNQSALIMEKDSDDDDDNDKLRYAWSVETDDFFSDRFRIKNAFSDEYLAVSVDNNQLEPSNVILLSKFNSETYDSVHWTLEPLKPQVD